MVNHASRPAALAAGVLGLAAVGALCAFAFATGGDDTIEVVPADAPAPQATATPASGVVPRGDDTTLWVDQARWSGVLDQVEAELSRRYGQTSKTDQRTPLVNGLIGRTLDYGAKEFV